MATSHPHYEGRGWLYAQGSDVADRREKEHNSEGVTRNYSRPTYTAEAKQASHQNVRNHRDVSP